MAISFLQGIKIQKYLILVLLGSLLIIALVFWFGFLKKPEVIPEVITPPQKIEINFEILKSPIFKELQPFKKILPFEEEIGRENPFIPYKIPTPEK